MGFLLGAEQLQALSLQRGVEGGPGEKRAVFSNKQVSKPFKPAATIFALSLWSR